MMEFELKVSGMIGAVRKLILKGTVVLVRVPGASHFPSIRLLENVQEVPNAEQVEKAERMDERGDDLQDICAVLGHGDPTTVRSFIHAFWQAEKKEPKPRYLSEDVGLLSEEDLERSRRRRSDLLDAPFEVEASGAKLEKDGQLVPILPLSWVGKRFEHGKHFESTLKTLPEVDRPRGMKIALDNLVLTGATWLSGESVLKQITTRSLNPTAMVDITYKGAALNVYIHKMEGKWVTEADSETKVFHVVAGVDGFTAKEQVAGDHSVVLRVDKELLNLENEEVPNDSEIEALLSDDIHKESGLLPTPSQRMCNVELPLSLMSKSIRRGTAFSSDRQLTQAMEILFHNDGKYNPTHQVLSKLFVTIFSDVCPYTTDEDPRILGIPEILGLSLVAQVDPKFQLPQDLQQKVITTALSLQARENHDHLWPWRGFSKKAAPLTITSETGDSIPNCVRTAIACAQLSSVEREMFRRYLNGLCDTAHPQQIHALPVVERKPTSAFVPTKTEMETLLASFDSRYSPNMLLLLQAALPFAPKSSTQHSIRAFGQFEARLSSHVNVRTIRNHLVGKATGNGVEEIFRVEQFVGKREKSKSSSSNASESITLKDTMDDTLNMTPHETMLMKILHSIQLEALRSVLPFMNWLQPFAQQIDLQQPEQLAIKDEMDESESGTSFRAGRNPTQMEARTAFLQLFGYTRSLKIGDGIVSVIVAGPDAENPLLVRDMEAMNTTKAKHHELNRYLKPDDPKVQAAQELLCESGSEIRKVDFPPPLGFRWVFGEKAQLKLDIRQNRRGRLRFVVNDSIEMDAFDGSPCLLPCNAPIHKVKLPGKLQSLIEKALYSGSTEKRSNDVDLLKQLDRLTSGLPDHSVFDWDAIGANTTIPDHVFRDVLLKIIQRDRDTFSFSQSSRINNNSWQYDCATEGTGVRVALALSALYPDALERILSHPNGFRFRVRDVATVQYVDLLEKLNELSFPKSLPATTTEAKQHQTKWHMEIITKLWSHQQETVDKVSHGILHGGLLGWCDASTVGAGKTLSALAVIEKAQRILVEKRGHTHLNGSLVLLPNNNLIHEWIEQILIHTKGTHVLVQNAQGFLKSYGVSNAGDKPYQADTSNVTGNSVVITTLARAREHPFNNAGWDLVVIDECLSVQNDTALHSAAAWRQVAASRCGVLLLSATFFRSRLSKLYYMIRMLRSPIPRKEAFLSTLLNEHAVVNLPENPRTWAISYRAVDLSDDVANRYRKTIEQKYHGGNDAKSIYATLKSFLRENYEQTLAIDAVAEEVERLRGMNRRPLVFATSEAEKKLLVDKIPNAEALQIKNKKEVMEKSGKVYVVTVFEGAHGLNLQGIADSIVTRPQPGDLVEQMKGRIDRFGQKRNKLLMSVIVARGTIEEAEASNIRLCGAFFRQYLDPLSKPFAQAAVSASVGGSKKKLKSYEKQYYNSKFQGQVADAFQAKIKGQEMDSESPRKRSRDKTKVEPGLEEDNEDEDDEEEPDEQIEKKKKTSTSKKRSRPNVMKVKPPKKANKKARVKKPHYSEFLSNGPPKVVDEKTIKDALQHFAKHDSVMATVAAQVGPPNSLLSIGRGDPFTSLARAIVYQQISTKAGASIFGRLADLCGGGESVNPSKILTFSEEKLREVGLSKRKAEYMRGLAQHFLDNNLSKERFHEMTDKEVYDSLIQVRGIGDWSIHMFLLFALGRSDILPFGDLVVQKGFKRLYNLTYEEEQLDTKVIILPTANEMLELSKTWRPYRSIGAWLMWHSIESSTCVYVY